MGFAVTVRGLDEVNDALSKIEQNVKPAVQKALQQAGLLVQRTAVQSIQHSSPTGHVYHHGNVDHVASSPGEPPATDTGGLVSSIQVYTGNDGLSIAVGSQLNYSTYLEYGTRAMEPRPFLNPALDVNKDKIVALIDKAVKQATNGRTQ